MENKDLGKVSKHFINQMLCYDKEEIGEISVKAEALANKTGVYLEKKIKSKGLILNSTQWKVLGAILKELTDTNYKGHKLMSTYEALNDKDLPPIYPTDKTGAFLYGSENSPYKNITAIPRLLITQSNLIRLAGYDPRKQSHRQNVVEALDYLRTHQCYFYWKRLKYKDGKPVKNKDGEYVFEYVEELATVLRVNKITDNKRNLDYYEIEPSACLLDQHDKYFLLIPKELLDNIDKKIKRKPSFYTILFLIWLYNEADNMRRYKKKDKTVSLEELVIILNMPESLYKKKKKDAERKIQEAIMTASSLGYIKNISKDDGTLTFYFNKDFYPQPGKLV
jgi:hypothetical protein